MWHINIAIICLIILAGALIYGKLLEQDEEGIFLKFFKRSTKERGAVDFLIVFGCKVLEIHPNTVNLAVLMRLIWHSVFSFKMNTF